MVTTLNCGNEEPEATGMLPKVANVTLRLAQTEPAVTALVKGRVTLVQGRLRVTPPSAASPSTRMCTGSSLARRVYSNVSFQSASGVLSGPRRAFLCFSQVWA